jgi:hypothetical protein
MGSNKIGTDTNTTPHAQTIKLIEINTKTDTTRPVIRPLSGPIIAERLTAHESSLERQRNIRPQAKTRQAENDNKNPRLNTMASQPSGNPDIPYIYDAHYQSVRANKALATKNAAEDYTAYSSIVSRSEKLSDLMVSSSNDPAYLSEIIRLAHRDEILNTFVSSFPSGLGLFNHHNGEYAKTDSRANERREAFITGLDAALKSGAITEQDIRDYGVYNKSWQKVASLTGVDQVGITKASAATTTELRQLQQTQNNAQDGVDKLNQELITTLSQTGPLTEQQQADFIEGFHNNPENKPTYDELLEATATLATFATNNQAAVLDAAVRDPETAELVFETITDLANNGHGKEGLALLGEIYSDPSSAQAVVFSDFSKLTNEVLGNASASTLSQLLAENKGDVNSAHSLFAELMQE